LIEQKVYFEQLIAWMFLHSNMVMISNYSKLIIRV